MRMTTGICCILVPLLFSCGQTRGPTGPCRAAAGHWQLQLTRDAPAPAQAKSERESFIISPSGELLDDQGQRHDQRSPAGRVDFYEDGRVCRVRIQMAELGKHSEPYLPPTYWVLVGTDGRLGGIGERVHFHPEAFTVTGQVRAFK